MLTHIDLNKDINSKCICKIGLIWLNKPIVMLDPCEHILHIDCLEENQNSCPICKNNITKINTVKSLRKQYKKDKTNMAAYQRYVDISCVKNFDDMSSYDITNIILTMPMLASVLYGLFVGDGKEHTLNICKKVFSLANTELTIKGTPINDVDKKCIFISNYTTYFDYFVLYYVLQCGFLASTKIKESFFGRTFIKHIPFVLTKRGKNGNTVNKIAKYVSKNGPICMFPEGMQTNPLTIAKFRSGAFNVGVPIYPIVINYDPPTHADGKLDFIFKLQSSKKLNITVTIMNKEVGPFDEKRIEEVRTKMSRVGNLHKSRVSNKDVIDD
jgi:1-acyl-sn-glycerol-3-phosphate acyltransferase